MIELEISRCQSTKDQRLGAESWMSTFEWLATSVQDKSLENFSMKEIKDRKLNDIITHLQWTP